jgi:hypothetical protein
MKRQEGLESMAAKKPAGPAPKKAAPAAPSPPKIDVHKPPVTPAAAPASPVRPAAALAPKSPASSPALRVKRPLPAKSVQKAANAFKNFSLSRFADGSTPSNYVPAAQAKVPSEVAAVQRKAIVANVATLVGKGPNDPGLGLALPSAQLASLLPSLDAAAGTVDTTELVGVLRQRMPGTELYASGNPTLNRVVQDSQLLSQVQARIAAIKKGGA